MNVRLSSPPSPGCAAALAGYLFICWYLQRIDVFTTHFTAHGAGMLLYNLCRVAFLPYFAWILAGAGWLLMAGLGRRGVSFSLSWLDRCLLGFFLGASLLTLAMLPLGFLKLYYPATALLLSVPILVFSYPYLAAELREGVRTVRELLSPAREPKIARAATASLAAAGLMLALIMLFTRCLYPGEASNDTYEIYWPYMRLVLKTHGIWPNDIWYMFYHYKAAGLNFLAMLLTDDLACQSVTYCMLLAGVAAVISLSRKIGGDTNWALLAGVAALACFPFTNPQWGAFHSHHIPGGVWIVAACWMAVLTFERTAADRRGWFLVFLVVVAGLSLYYPIFLVFVLPMLGVVGAGQALVRQPGVARGYLLVLLGAGAVAAGLMLLNYAIGGMFLDNPLGPMWRLANQGRFSRWCTPFLPQFVMEGSAPKTTGGLSLSGLLSHDREYWLNLFRVRSLGILWLHAAVPPVLAAIATAAIVARPAAVAVRWVRLAPVLVPLAVSLAISDSAHPDSVYRNYAFVCFLLPAALCSLWQAALAWLAPARARGVLAVGFVMVAALFSVSLAVQRSAKHREPDKPSRWPDFAGFAAGKLSLKDALSRGDGLWEMAEFARKTVGAQGSIYSFNHPPYGCSFIFPGPDLLTEPSRTNFGGKWDIVAFGSAESAMAVLKGQHINYFLIDFSKLFFGLVPFSPLFDPQHLSERFDIVWYRDVPEWDGQSLPREIASEFGSPYVCLLTWRGQGNQPLPSFIADSLRNRVRVNRRRHFPLADDRWGQLYSNMSIVYDFNQGKGYPLQRPAGLRRVRGYN